jgi:phospholipid transport system transporter-binding protein
MSGVEFETLAPGRFRLKGELTFETVGHAVEAGERLFAEHKHIELDLDGVETTDSAGLALLVEWIGWARREKRGLRYHHVPQQVMALARISEVDKLLPVV